MKLGFKTFTSIIMLALVVAMLWYSNFISWHRLSDFHPLTLFLIGILTAFFSAIFGQLFGSERTSAFALRIERKKNSRPGDIELLRSKYLNIIVSENRPSDAFDFPPIVLKSIIVVIFACVAFLAVNDRTLNLIASLGDRFQPSSAEYCPTESPVLEEDDEELPGCELVIRAYKLGYAKSLGDCDKKAKELEPKEICTLRQHDEPLLHYTWRKLRQSYDDYSSRLSDDLLAREKQKFEWQLEKIDDLVADKILTLNASPRSAHFIFTNLPPPKNHWMRLFESVFQADACIQDFNNMPNTLTESSDKGRNQAKSLEYSFGHLLFNATHRSSVGYCREYQVVWNAPSDSCQTLSNSSEEFLRKQGVWQQVDTVLKRYQVDGSIQALQERLANLDEITSEAPKATLPGLDPTVSERLSQALSFQCFMTQDGQSRSQEYSVHLAGKSFQAHEVLVDHSKSAEVERIPTEYLNKLSRVLAPKFRYSAYLSNQRPQALAEEDMQAQFNDSSQFLLTKLEYLRDADIILGHDWLNEREDLLEVYPWHLHLYHFVDTFRNQYEKERGRL